MSNRAAYGYRAAPLGFGKIWAHMKAARSMENFPYGVGEWKFRPQRPRSADYTSPFIIPHQARAVNRQNGQKLRVDFSTLNKSCRKCHRTLGTHTNRNILGVSEVRPQFHPRLCRDFVCGDTG